MGGAFSCCMPPRGGPVALPVPCEGAVHPVDLAASELFRLPGLATAYHTSVLVDGEEFFFSDSGIYSDRAVMSHQGKPSEMHRLGYSTRTGAQLFTALHPHFKPGTYDLIRKNCNSFSDCALFFLLGRRLDSRYSMLERLGQKASSELLNKVTKGAYHPNEVAKNFRSDDVVAAVKGLTDADLTPSAGAAAGSKPAFSFESRVTIVGLRSAERLNGQGATIIRYNSVNGRWEARLHLSGEVKAFRAENLRPAGELVLQPKDRVRVHGLRSDVGVALNGLEGEVTRYLPEVSRYEVRVSDLTTKALRAENLALI